MFIGISDALDSATDCGENLWVCLIAQKISERIQFGWLPVSYKSYFALNTV
jgi:hypothetical protein